MQFLKNLTKKKIIIIITITITIASLIVIALITNSSNKGVKASINQNNIVSNNDEILVNITGEVNKPGIYSVPNGSLVNDVIITSGGFTKYADTDSVNLIQKVKDGDKIVVKRKVDNTNTDLININTATISELTKLTGIGEAKASAIVTYRETYGKFQSIEELMNVQGISQSVFDKIKDYITVK